MSGSIHLSLGYLLFFVIFDVGLGWLLWRFLLRPALSRIVREQVAADLAKHARLHHWGDASR